MRFPDFIHKLFFGTPPESVCPICLGDGRDEGWKTAFPCTACGGYGKYHSNEESNREIRRNISQNENQRMKKLLSYSKYQKWLNKKYNL